MYKANKQNITSYATTGIRSEVKFTGWEDLENSTGCGRRVEKLAPADEVGFPYKRNINRDRRREVQ